jgi:hypothetical protein
MATRRFILPLAAVMLLFVSCDKDNGSAPTDTSGASSYQEQDWDWDKNGNDKYQLYL